MILHDFSPKLEKFRLKKCRKMPDFECFSVFFCVYIRKCLKIKEKKVAFFAKIILKSVAQFKKKPYICINKIKQY